MSLPADKHGMQAFSGNSCNHPVLVAEPDQAIYSLLMNTTNIQEKISILQIAFKGLEEHELREMAEQTQFRTYPAGSCPLP